MKLKVLCSAMIALLVLSACSSTPTESSSESAPVPVTAAPPEPTPAAEAPKTDIQACEGKAAKDPCAYTSEKGEVNGACVRSESYALKCAPKKSKK